LIGRTALVCAAGLSSKTVAIIAAAVCIAVDTEPTTLTAIPVGAGTTGSRATSDPVVAASLRIALTTTFLIVWATFVATAGLASKAARVIATAIGIAVDAKSLFLTTVPVGTRTAGASAALYAIVAAGLRGAFAAAFLITRAAFMAAAGFAGRTITVVATAVGITIDADSFVLTAVPVGSRAAGSGATFDAIVAARLCVPVAAALLVGGTALVAATLLAGRAIGIVAAAIGIEIDTESAGFTALPVGAWAALARATLDAVVAADRDVAFAAAGLCVVTTEVIAARATDLALVARCERDADEIVAEGFQAGSGIGETGALLGGATLVGSEADGTAAGVVAAVGGGS
jgi:hypothetical protein